MLVQTAARDGWSSEELDARIGRRVDGEPLEHVVGWALFCGLRVPVDPGVFVPRRRTELLVRTAAAAVLAQGRREVVVLDLCCGSGALSLALAALLGERCEVMVFAVDVDERAVRCADRNLADDTLAALGIQALRLGVMQGDLFGPLPDGLRGRVDVLLANVPYVPSGEVALLPREARDHEPLVTLDGGADGLAVLRRVVAQAFGWLAAGGCLLSETSQAQAPAAVAAFEAAGLVASVVTDDDLGATVIFGRRRGASE